MTFILSYDVLLSYVLFIFVRNICIIRYDDCSIDVYDEEMRMSLILIMCMVLCGCAKKQARVHNEPMNAPASQVSDSATVLFGKSTIDERIKDYMSDIQACYEQALKKDSGGNGRIVMRFDIVQEGNVVNLEPQEDSLSSPEFTKCLVDVFSKMQFSAGMQSDIVGSNGTKNISVSYPLLFSPE